MIKLEELSDRNSCLNKAGSYEMVFVLRAKDKAAPAAIRAWALERIALGLNNRGDDKIVKALNCADVMETQRRVIESMSTHFPSAGETCPAPQGMRPEDGKVWSPDGGCPENDPAPTGKLTDAGNLHVASINRADTIVEVADKFAKWMEDKAISVSGFTPLNGQEILALACIVVNAADRARKL